MNIKTIDLNKIFLAICSGLLLTGSFPKADMPWMAWFAFVPLLFSLRDISPGDGFRLGFLAGIVHSLTLVYWLVYTMQTYGNLPLYLAVPVLFLLAAYLSLYPAFFSMIFIWMRPPVNFTAAPFLWVSLEYIRAFMLSGFPWELMGHSQFKNLHIIQISDIFGVYGVSFLIIMSNTALFTILLYVQGKEWKGKNAGRRYAAAYLIIFLLLTGMTFFYGNRRIKTIDGLIADSPRAKVSLVQGNIDQMVKWDPDFQESSTKKYVDLSLSAKPDKPELVVWPETAAPFYFLYNAEMTGHVIKGIREMQAYFLVGSPSFIRNENGIDYYNSAYLMGPDGRSAGKYDKVHLVPFGEYVPLKKWLPFIKKLVVQAGDFKTGKKGAVFKAGPYKLGILICYEIIFPGLSKAVSENGADLLVNITNDAWYGITSAPYQHFSMAVFRAVENKRSLVRSANTGISAFIDPAGRITGSTPLFKEAVMTQTLPVIKLKTVYTCFGDIFAVTCLGLTIFTIFILYRRKAK